MQSQNVPLPMTMIEQNKENYHPSQSTEIECYLMRHAESKFNQMIKILQMQSLPLLTKDQRYFDHRLIDCSITDNGIREIQNLSHSFSNSQKNCLFFDIAFVSPLNRTLETAKLAYEKRKIGYKKIVVLPGLTEVVKNICDFGDEISQKISKYREFDFSLIDKQDIITGQKHWQDQIIDKQYRDQIDYSKKNGQRYLRILSKIYPESLESTSRCLQRSWKVIQQIKDICKEERAKSILLITHNRILKNIINGGHEDKSANTEVMGNCQIQKIQL